VWVDAQGSVIGPNMLGAYFNGNGAPFVTHDSVSLIDSQGYIWAVTQATQADRLNNTAHADGWFNDNRFVLASGWSTSIPTTSFGSSLNIGVPIYENQTCSGPAQYFIPREPRRVFAYWIEGETTPRFGAVKDNAVPPFTGIGGGWYQHAGASCFGPLANGASPQDTFSLLQVQLGDPNVVWDITPPSATFTLPFHVELR
jgi:hypothetical protein